MAEPEKKIFVTNSEMLEQVLRNQALIIRQSACKFFVEERASRLAETEALLARID